MDAGVGSPLEQFVRDYVEVSGGVWDEVDPQVYDLLLDDGAALRVAFDPEAVPEHPGAQFASYGTPLVDRFLTDAVARGRFAQLYLAGLNLSPHDLAGRARRGLTLPPETTLTLGRARLLDFPQAVFWFQATFISDQKEQDVLPVALDLHHGRQVRHLDELLDPARLADAPAQHLAEAPHLSLAAARPLARERVLRTLAALANTRSRETREQAERQIARMRRYYAQLREELDEQAERARSRQEDLSRFPGRRQAMDREEQLRVGELRQKTALRIQLRLLQLLVVHQPKFWLQATLTRKGTAVPLRLVWDPLTEALEAVACPQCRRPTLTLEWARQGQLACPQCSATPSPRR
jgi:hypothetical protein